MKMSTRRICTLCNHKWHFLASRFRQFSSTSKSFEEKSIADEQIQQEDEEPSPKLWEDPYRYAYGPVRAKPKFTEVKESPDEWRFVERLFPKSTIPEIPEHDIFPTPSGWVPPQGDGFLDGFRPKKSKRRNLGALT